MSPVAYTMYDYSISDTGTLQKISTSGIGVTTSGAIDSVIHPAGNYMYVSNQGSGSITRILVNGDGSLGSKEYFLWVSSNGYYTSYALGLALIRKKKE